MGPALGAVILRQQSLAHLHLRRRCRCCSRRYAASRKACDPATPSASRKTCEACGSLSLCSRRCADATQTPNLLGSHFANRRQLRVVLPHESRSFAPTLLCRPLLHRTADRDCPSVPIRSSRSFLGPESTFCIPRRMLDRFRGSDAAPRRRSRIVQKQTLNPRRDSHQRCRNPQRHLSLLQRPGMSYPSLPEK